MESLNQQEKWKKRAYCLNGTSKIDTKTLIYLIKVSLKEEKNDKKLETEKSFLFDKKNLPEGKTKEKLKSFKWFSSFVNNFIHFGFLSFSSHVVLFFLFNVFEFKKYNGKDKN